MLEQPVLASSESELESADEDSGDGSDFGPATPNMGERPLVINAHAKPFATLPPEYVRERLAYFNDVKAYELEVESPQAEGEERSPHFASGLEEDDFDVLEVGRQRGWRPLEAVVEEEVAEEDVTDGGVLESTVASGRGAKEDEVDGSPETGPSDTMAEHLASLGAEQELRGGEGKGASVARDPEHGSHLPPLGSSGVTLSKLDGPKQGLQSEPGECNPLARVVRIEEGQVSKVETDHSVRRLVFEDIPPNVPRGRRTSPTELKQARVKGGFALTNPEKVKDSGPQSGLTVTDISQGLEKLSLQQQKQGGESEGVSNKGGARWSVDGARRESRRRRSLAKHWKVAREPETPLQAILRACGQETMASLNDFISRFYPVDMLSKLGEGTFGEAFKAGDMCFKIVPMGSHVKVNGEAQKTVEEMYSEVLLTNAITSIRFAEDSAMLPENASNNFIQTYGIGICTGAYSHELIAAWETWDQENGSENDHPEIFQDNQVYVVFAFADGGSDLEHFTLHTYDEAVSLLLQVVVSLAAAEQACNFEHRDMHWGNILLARRGQEEVSYRLEGKTVRARSAGISVALIDFTLSRLDAEGRVLFCDLTADTWLFEGPKNDVQADTYRRMKKATRGCWEGSFPETNSFWIHYLVDIVLHRKSFICTSGEKHALRGFRKRSLTYKSATGMVEDELFEGFWLPRGAY